jgi:tetratricopeptide (TPR) repeat protein
MIMTAVAIEHVTGVSPSTFILKRLPDGKSMRPVVVPSPYETAVDDQPRSNLMHELRWYLEKFLKYPFPPATNRAENVLKALKTWGSQAFEQLFDHGDAAQWLASSEVLQIRSDDSAVLSWPWEALVDPRAGYLGQQRRVERRMNELPDPPEPANLPQDRVNILLVIARPFAEDVAYRSVGLPLVELIRSRALPAQVDILRPPTFDQLRDELRRHPGYYHVLHFDGHGEFGTGSGQPSRYTLIGQQGQLIFEDARGAADPKQAADLSALLREYAVSTVVLNACQSAMLDETAQSAFGSVATALLQSGVRSVVAMAYALYVSGAQVFLPAFYRRLFEKGSVADAVRAGRQEMVAHKGRVCARGRYPLEDWLLPVLYQQDATDFTFAAQANLPQKPTRLPEEVSSYRPPYGFVGREGPILKMERALHRGAPAILVQGLSGAGKTALARGFLRWLDETGGLDKALWFDFRDIRNALYVINAVGSAVFGGDFAVLPDRMARLADRLRAARLVMVWDNFESAGNHLTEEDRSRLGAFLDGIRGGRTKVIITSRSTEQWLKPEQRMEIFLGGLHGEERWEYCEAILLDLGLHVDRNDQMLSALMDQLSGHPLAMRAVLPKLEHLTPAQVAEALRSNLAELNLPEDEEEGRLFATLRFVEQGLDEPLRPLLRLVALHEGHVAAAYLVAMGAIVNQEWTEERAGRCLSELAGAGLMWDIGNSVYELHPLLTSYLRARGDDRDEACRRAFVLVISKPADDLLPLPLHQQRRPFEMFGANFQHALALAESLSMDQQVSILLQALGIYAANSENFPDAIRYYTRLEHVTPEGSKLRAIAWHQLGIIAQRQREFPKARDYFLKSLRISENQDPAQAAKTYYHLGGIAESQRDFQMARSWYLKGLTIDEENAYWEESGTTYDSLGSLAEQEDKLEEAKHWLDKALHVWLQRGREENAARTFHDLGVVAQRGNDMRGARAYYRRSAAIAERLGMESNLAKTYHQLGILARYEGDLAGAQDWYLRAVEIKEKLGDLLDAASTYNQLGNISQLEGNLRIAREWFRKSLETKKSYGEVHGAALTYNNLGGIAAMEGNWRDAAKWLALSIDAAHRTDDSQIAEHAKGNFYFFRDNASPEDRRIIDQIWSEFQSGKLPEEPTS